MMRAQGVLSPDDPRLAAAVADVTLTRNDRHRRRVRLEADDGRAFLLDLPAATRLVDGAGLLLDDGSVIRVRAAIERALKITAPSAEALTRLAWHLGNRHTPCEVTTDALYIEPDHVLAEMIRGLGGEVSEVSRPFEPESGAYAGHAHGHDHA